MVGMRIGTMKGVFCRPHNFTDRFCEIAPPIPLGGADSYRVPLDPAERRRVVLGGPTGDGAVARPIHIGRNSWVGFGACVLPGVTIDEGSIIAARSVVAMDVPAYVVVAGNPARIVQPLTRDEIERP
jgi:acetyltransferase-like isoleucine patch superfamily enzyme